MKKKIAILSLFAVVIALGVQFSGLVSINTGKTGDYTDSDNISSSVNIFLDMDLEDLLEIVVVPKGESKLQPGLENSSITIVDMPYILVDNLSRGTTVYASC